MLWHNDVFELFFRPDAAKPGYYEFQVNAAGTMFDMFYPAARLRRHPQGQQREQVPHRREGETPRHAQQARRQGQGLDRRGANPVDRLPAHRRPAAAGRGVEVQPLPLRLPQGLEGTGTVVRRAAQEEDALRVLPPVRGLRHADVRRPGRDDREAVRHRQARTADDEHGRRLPRPAAAVSRASARSPTTSPISRSWFA